MESLKLLNLALKKRKSSLKKLGFATYVDYLSSTNWKRIRSGIFKRARGRCEVCGERPPVNVHHWSYSVATLLGARPMHLEAVCRPCHDTLHCTSLFTAKRRRQKRPPGRSKWCAIAQPAATAPRLVKRPGAA